MNLYHVTFIDTDGKQKDIKVKSKGSSQSVQKRIEEKGGFIIEVRTDGPPPPPTPSAWDKLEQQKGSLPWHDSPAQDIPPQEASDEVGTNESDRPTQDEEAKKTSPEPVELPIAEQPISVMEEDDGVTGSPAPYPTSTPAVPPPSALKKMKWSAVFTAITLMMLLIATLTVRIISATTDNQDSKRFLYELERLNRMMGN